jgi:hypothetical protein
MGQPHKSCMHALAQSLELFPKMNSTEPFILVQASSQQDLNTLDRGKD